jgi:NADPH2:quinone reductase
MPKRVVCRELGPPETLRLETFASAPLVPEVRVAKAAQLSRHPDPPANISQADLPFTPVAAGRGRGQRRYGAPSATG